MKTHALVSGIIALATGLSVCVALQDEQANNGTSIKTNKLFTYAGPLLPSDWSLVSLLNDRAIIGFTNGTARSSPMTELDPKDRSFLQRLQNGTVYATPLASAKEKLTQWSSSVSSTVSKLSKSVRDQLDTIINNKPTDTNATVVFTES